MNSFITYNGLIINESFLEFLKESGLADFERLKDFKEGSLFKKTRMRSVSRIEVNNRVFYLKRHFWPFRERVKALIPWISKEDACNEWEKLLLLDSLGFNTMVPVAFGEKRRFGIPIFSLTLTENLYDAEKMEKYLPSHFSPPLHIDRVLEKRAFIRKLAAFAMDFHNKGLNHQDFYLGHLYIRPEDSSIFIIDVQRAHQKIAVNMHDRIKDLSQIAYSAKSLKIFTKSDLMRFILAYLDSDKLTHADKKLTKKIISKVKRIARHDAKLQSKKGKLLPESCTMKR